MRTLTAIKMRKLLSLLLITFSANAYSGGPVLPENWRMPTDQERCETRFDFCFGVLASGDFDGNGLVDGAVIAISKDNIKEGLLVFMYESPTKVVWHTLSMSSFDSKVSMGVAPVSAGVQKVLCESEAECSMGYKKEVQLPNESFSYYRFASSSSIWVFDNGDFRRIWQSD